MAGGKETPRQKMVGMMYLVLTALLAMNAPKELINSFVVINEGLQKSNAGLEDKNKLTIESFGKLASEDPKYQANYGVAQKISEEGKKLYMHIEELKRYMIARVEKHADTSDLLNKPDSIYDLSKVLVKDNYDIPTYIMIGSDPSKPIGEENKYSAARLRKLMSDFKNVVLGAFDEKKDPDIFATVNKNFGFADILDHGKLLPWEIGSFYHLPLASVVTNLTRIQLDVLNTEADAMNKLVGNVDKNRIKVDNLFAKVIPNTTYVMLGDSFIADIFIAASSSQIIPEVYVAQSGSPDMDKSKAEKDRLRSVGNGIVQYAFKPTTEGVIEWGGFVEVKQPDGTYEKYEIKDQSFRVAKASLTVSATKMNVFYRGLDNPISVSAPGVATEDIVVSCNNGSVVAKDKKRGDYIVKPGAGKDAMITLSATVNGKKVNLGNAGFRVKDVPPPTPEFAGVTGSGSATINQLKAAIGVLAKLQDFDFEGVKYEVIEFSMSSVVKGALVEKKTKGNKVTPEMKSLIDAARTGTKIYIEGIKAQGPGGKIVSLGSISVKVQ